MDNVPSRLLPERQWPHGISCAWAHDVYGPNMVLYFCSYYFNRVAAKMYSFDICFLKIITTCKFIINFFAKLKNIISNNTKEVVLNFT